MSNSTTHFQVAEISENFTTAQWLIFESLSYHYKKVDLTYKPNSSDFDIFILGKMEQMGVLLIAPFNDYSDAHKSMHYIRESEDAAPLLSIFILRINATNKLHEEVRIQKGLNDTQRILLHAAAAVFEKPTGIKLD